MTIFKKCVSIIKAKNPKGKEKMKKLLSLLLVVLTLTLILSACGTDGGEIMFFSKGKKTAEYQTGDPVPVLTAGTADGKQVVICGSQNGIMYCCSPDGKTLFWTCNLGSGVTAQLVHDRNIWAGTADGHLYKLAENGRILAEKQLAGQVLKIAVSGSTIAALTPEGVEIFK